LNTKPSTVQKRDQGKKHPNGPSPKLLNIVDSARGVKVRGLKMEAQIKAVSTATGLALKCVVGALFQRQSFDGVVAAAVTRFS
jgi:hypothetical protein